RHRLLNKRGPSHAARVGGCRLAAGVSLPGQPRPGPSADRLLWRAPTGGPPSSYLHPGRTSAVPLAHSPKQWAHLLGPASRTTPPPCPATPPPSAAPAPPGRSAGRATRPAGRWARQAAAARLPAPTAPPTPA